MTQARREAERELLAWMRDEPEREDDARFARIAQHLFAHQFEHCAPYRRFCEGRGATPASVSDWRAIPAVPTGAFKEFALRSFDPSAECHVFRTSGTSQAKRGALHLDTLEVYEASLRPVFERGVLPDLAKDAPVRLLVVAPSPDELPDSSLSHMFGVMRAQRGDPGSAFLMKGGELQVDAARRALDDAATSELPIALCGTAFGFVHLSDALLDAGHAISLPASARIMETGGFKGRSRSLERGELYARLEAAFGVPPERVVNQYGMTELGSQFYDPILSDAAAGRAKLAPPWTRVRLLDPESGDEVPEGRPGIVTIFDAANTGSVCAVQTADLGVRRGAGFEVLGRAEGAEARGCSIAVDEMLGG